MEYSDILRELAPCGLNCRKCMAYREGDIRKTSEELQRRLGSFDRYAERFTGFLPVFANYPAFKELLAHFAQADCEGCRSGQCKFPNCGVMTCHTEKGVDFCFQCDDFPCQQIIDFNNDGFRHHSEVLDNIRRQREIGLDAWVKE